MRDAMESIILASASPRRRELLMQIGIDFTVDASDVDENIEASGPRELVRALSRQKAEAVARKHPLAVVIGADTVVVCDEAVLGKPADEADALSMLTMLAGRTHKVMTGVTICRISDEDIRAQRIKECPGEERIDEDCSFEEWIIGEQRIEICTFDVSTDVVMYANDADALRAYIATGEPMDKAGAYGIQGRGAVLVKEIHGDYNNVVGLPVAETVRRLRDFCQNKTPVTDTGE